jgi:hypothetical protein
MISRRSFIVGLAAAAVGALALSRSWLSSARTPVPDVPGRATPAATPTPAAVQPPLPTRFSSLSPTPEPPTSTATASPGASAAPETVAPSPSAQVTTGPSVVALENERPGSRAWDLPANGRPAVEGYVSQRSVAPGDVLSLHAAGDGPVDVEWWRLGWYRGNGGRVVRADPGIAVPPRGPMPRPASDTGLVEAGWPAVLDVQVGRDWTSGIYVAVLRPAFGRPAFAPFVVRQSREQALAPVLFVSAAATWQAYNGWGGKSLYGYNSYDLTTAVRDTRAAIVSFDRPYDVDAGAGYLRRWELQFVRWQERNGRDVAYAADIDLALHPEVFSGRRLIVFAGHHEYWSRSMRAALEGLVASGTNVAFLSANEIYWQVRLEDGPLGPASRIVCYKSAAYDPLVATAPSLTTCRWREAPVAEPEAALIGQMYGHVVAATTDWVVTNPGHWLYEGTGVDEGDRFVNLVGQEYDTLYPELAPAAVDVIARSPVVPGLSESNDPGAHPSPAIHTATVYTAGSGATIVAAGTFQWSWAIDRYGDRSYHGRLTPFERRVGRMTQNLFDRLGDGPRPPGAAS